MAVTIGRPHRLPQCAGSMRKALRTSSRHDRRRLALFVLLSATVHALLLGQRAPYALERAASPDPMLHVTLTGALPSAPAPTLSAAAPKAHRPKRRPQAIATPRSATERPAQRKDAPAAIPDAAKASMKPEETAYAERPSAAASETSPPDDGEGNEAAPVVEASSRTPGNDESAGITGASRKAAIRGLLLRDLARHLQYPPLARRAGWEGTVLLAVTLDPDGVLAAVRVERSSGYEILDRAAADTLRRVGRIQEAAKWLHGQTLELLLPIVYRLTD